MGRCGLKYFILIFLVALAAPFSANAQAEEDATIVSARELGDEIIARAEVVAVDGLEGGNGVKLSAFPIVGFTPETGWAFSGYGILTYPSNPGRELSSLNFYAAYTLRQQILVGAGHEHYTAYDRWMLRTNFNFKKWVEDYYGLGDASRSTESFSYDLDSMSASFEALRAIGESGLRLGFNVKGKWLYHRDWDDLVAADPRVHGAERSFRLSAGLRGEFDTRDTSFAPTTGYYVIAEGRLFPQLTLDDPPFGRFLLDARGYFNLGKEHVIAIRSSGTFVTDYAPLTELVSVGGSQSLKGIADNLGLNTNATFAQFEYRTPYLWRFGFVAGAGIGTTWGEYGAMGCCTPQAVVSGGVRFALQPENRINLAVDIGWSGASPEFYLSIGESF